jgi:hypothetical protein
MGCDCFTGHNAVYQDLYGIWSLVNEYLLFCPLRALRPTKAVPVAAGSAVRTVLPGNISNMDRIKGPYQEKFPWCAWLTPSHT